MVLVGLAVQLVLVVLVLCFLGLVVLVVLVNPLVPVDQFHLAGHVVLVGLVYPVGL